NAVEASPGGGKIHVSAVNTSSCPGVSNLPPGYYLRITIRDHGAGIAREHLSRIYDPFFTTKKQARGLGLAAAYSIIQRHGGHIAVESAPGEGTSVVIYLRAVRPSASAAPAPSAGRHAPVEIVPVAGEGGRRVLIMDDDEGIRVVGAVMFK